MLKTRIFTTLVVLSNVLGNFSLTWGMRQVGRVLSLSPWPYIAALFNPWVAVGVTLLMVWLISQMTLLSWADELRVMTCRTRTPGGAEAVGATARAAALGRRTRGKRPGRARSVVGVARD